jgi:urease alpha subunit
MTMEQLVKTISEVYEMSYGTAQGPISSHLQFHKEAQLLIATGTVDEINFVAETLAALRQKLDHKPKAGTGGGGGGGGPKAELKPTTEKTKTP